MNTSLSFDKVYYLPLGRVFVMKTHDNYFIETTEMRTVNKDGLMLEDIKECWDHIVDYKDKWIMDISTQKGCVYQCLFCDVPNNIYKGNLSTQEIIEQIQYILLATPYVQESKDLSIYFARMGEPSHNIENVLNAINILPIIVPHGIQYTPVINTILPKKANNLSGFDVLDKMIEQKNRMNGKMDINISCSTTNEESRRKIVQNNNIYDILDIINYISQKKILGNKIRLNFILMEQEPFDISIFEQQDMSNIELRLTPLTNTTNSKKNGMSDNFSFIKEVTQQLKEKNISYHVLYTPHMKTFGLGCGQFLSLNKKTT